jgi:protein O-GlcNAc transferase
MAAAPDLGARFAQALAAHEQGDLPRARQGYAAIVALDPTYFDAWLHAGIVALQMGDVQAALPLFRKAATLNPNVPALLANQAIALAQAGELDGADRLLTRLIEQELTPGHLVNRANVRERRGERSLAEADLNAALSLDPDHIEALTAFGRIATAKRDFVTARQVLKRALERRPQHFSAAFNLANVAKDLGDLDLAQRQYQTAAQLRPHDLSVRSAALLARCYGELTVEDWRAQWADLDAALLAQGVSATRQSVAKRPRHGGRPLHVAYVSGDFRSHAVAHFLLGVLPNHDRAQFTVTLIATHPARDGVTEQLARSHQLVDGTRLNDAQMAAACRAANVDIAIDLSGHSSGNRLAAFARRLAPMQLTWLGFLGSTGLAPMDYRLTDATADPVGAEAWHRERLLRMPEPYALWTYQAIADDALTATRSASVLTYGSLNHPAKLSTRCLTLWGDILAAKAEARLLLHGYADAAWRERVLRVLTGRGTDPRQVEWVGFLSGADYRALWQQIDLALDPMPWSGGVTTCDALAAGVPVLTCAPPATPAQPFARTAAASLRAAGFAQWITESPEAYRDRAIAIQSPLTADERAANRQRFLTSALTDGPGFTRAYERLLLTTYDNHTG